MQLVAADDIGLERCGVGGPMRGLPAIPAITSGGYGNSTAPLAPRDRDRPNFCVRGNPLILFIGNCRSDSLLGGGGRRFNPPRHYRLPLVIEV